MKADLLNLITTEDCTGDLKLIADVLGIEVARKVFNAFRGCCLYIPGRIPRDVVARYAAQQKTKGKRVKDIANDTGLSERWIQIVLAAAQQ